MERLERELTGLAAAIDWPATPDTVPSLTSGVATPRHARWRRHLALAVAALAVALAAAFAVPQSRGAILRLLRLGGVTVELVDRLPPAQERPLSSGLGPAVTLAVARRELGGTLLSPPLSPRPALHLTGQVVSMLFLARGAPVLLSELYAPSGYFLKKVVAGGTEVESVKVGADDGLWLTGRPHLFVVPDAPPRLAGNVLVWTHEGLTLRLEGRELTLERAQELARSLR
jgi:hypothetical protein